MADERISAMTLLTLLAQLDEFEVLDKSDLTDGAGGTNKRITYEILAKAFGGETGNMINGKIVPSVAANNLTVALKTLAGSDPSTTDPVFVRIGDTWHTITSALSVTKNAGTNWCNAGGAELATQEIDYFVYLGYNATDGVVIGFSRISHAALYSDFSTTDANEKYAAISTITNAAAGDDYAVIGRFAATLSAGAGYTWTVPTFTTKNLIQRPIYDSRWLSWTPAYSAGGAMTYTGVSTGIATYKITRDTLEVWVRASGTTGGVTNNLLRATLPFDALFSTSFPIAWGQINDGAAVTSKCGINDSTPDYLNASKYDGALVTLAAGVVINLMARYQI